MTTELKESQRTFSMLFEDFQYIEIPIIQRDYAQGRDTAADIRSGLLDAIHEKLKLESSPQNPPLDLDFIYGSIMSLENEELKFCPLDGQQRLTTLFLLHWYAACKDGEGEAFRKKFCDGKASRFVYRVRESSTEFFDALCQFMPDASEINSKPPSALLKEGPWFFLYWEQDPTVQSALCMLDAIQETFRDSENLFQRLIASEHPRITFQLLELEQFGLTDDLYIKMNARGKPLTAFENFKARIEHHLETEFADWEISNEGAVEAHSHFSQRIEKEWTNLFWDYRNEDYLFDDRVMNLYRTLILITRDPEDEPQFQETRETIRSKREPISFLICQRLGVNDKAVLSRFITCLDHWSGGEGKIKLYLEPNTYFDEATAFDRASDSKNTPAYDELIQFHAYTAYLESHEEIEDQQAFGEWMRISSNLAKNTIYNRQSDFLRSHKAITAMLPHADDILIYMASSGEDVSGLNEQQVREEQLKAQLMLKSENWRDLILEAESHGYFQGQIEFLFKFSGILDAWAAERKIDWSDDQDESYQASFKNYFRIASMVFNASGVVSLPDSLWERALLSEGDYLFESTRDNYSFLTNEGREISWKRLLRGNPKDSKDEERRDIVQKVFDQISPDENLEKSLQKIIGKADVSESWRKYLVDDPRLIGWCDKRLLRLRSEEKVYLLKATQMNGRHAELFSYYYYLNHLEQLVDRGELGPFDKSDYIISTSTEEPYVDIFSSKLNEFIRIGMQNTRDDIANLEIFCVAPESYRESLLEKLEDQWFTEADAEPQLFKCSRSIKVEELADSLKALGKVFE